MSVDAPSPASPPDVRAEAPVPWRPTAGAVTTAAGAAVVALAMVLPWCSIPGGAYARALLELRGEAVPATGPLWRSLPLTSVVVLGLVVLAVVAVALSVTAHRLRRRVAWATAGSGVLVAALLVDRLFVERPAPDVTEVGAGGYVGLAGVLAVTVGAGLVAREHEATARDPRAMPAVRLRPETRPRGRELAWPWSAGAAAALVVTYLATRLSLADRFPYFFDEALYAGHAQLVARSHTDAFVALEFGQGPLMTWLAVAWVELGFAPLTSVRLVSLLAGLLTVGVVGLLARSVLGPAVGWVAAGLCVVLPFYVVHDGIGVYEPLVTLIVAASLYLQIEFARRPRLWLAGLLGVVLAAGVLTKLNTLPALVLLPVSLLCFDWSGPGRRRRVTRWLQGIAVATAIVVAAYLLQRSSSYYVQLEATRNSLLLWPARTVTAVLDDPFAVVEVNWESYSAALGGYVTVPILALAVVGAVLAWRDRPRTAAFLVASFLVFLAVALLFQLRPYPRHAMSLTPPLLVLSAYALVRATTLAQRRLAPGAAVGVCTLGAVLVMAPAALLDVRALSRPATAHYPGLDYWQYVAGWPAGGPWQDAADLIRRRGNGRDMVILSPGSYLVLRLMLEDDGGRYRFVTPASPLAAKARLAVFDSERVPIDPKGFRAELDRHGFAPIGRFSRPDGPCSGPREPSCGGTVTVLARSER